MGYGPKKDLRELDGETDEQTGKPDQPLRPRPQPGLLGPERSQQEEGEWDREKNIGGYIDTRSGKEWAIERIQVALPGLVKRHRLEVQRDQTAIGDKNHTEQRDEE